MQINGDHEQLVLPEGASLVFALRWFPVVGSRIDRLARRKAHEACATHYVQGGTNAVAVGCARLRGCRKYYAAAQCFARIYPHGTVAGLLRLSESRTWLVASQDGAVMTRTDRIYPTVLLATQALEELDRRHPGLVHSVRHLVLSDLVAALDASTALRRLRLTFARLTVSLRGGVGLIALVLSLPLLWHLWRGEPPLQQDGGPLDAAQAWRHAVATATKPIALHKPKLLSRIFDALKALPLVLNGWSLRTAQCRFQGERWFCRASYARTSPDATNARFIAKLPTTVQVHFNNLDEADITWSVISAVQPLDPTILAPAAHTDQVFASALQRVQPMFSRIALGTPTHLSILPPRDEQGRWLPAPQDLPRIQQRTISVAGPLRSFSLLPYESMAMSWTEVALVVQATRAPSVIESPLMVQLQGNIYELE
jgi:hypothetical protein